MRSFLTALMILTACTSDAPSIVEPSTPADGGGSFLSHTFPPFEVDSGEEVFWECQSWTLNNPEPIYVNAVHATTQGAFHHSNWFAVPDTYAPGLDGTWPCAERNFDEIVAGVAGTVLFAQSTQATGETQRFPPGTALRIPAQSKIVGDVHLLNVTPSSLTTSIQLDLSVVQPAEVQTQLNAMVFDMHALNIRPGRFRITA